MSDSWLLSDPTFDESIALSKYFGEITSSSSIPKFKSVDEQVDGFFLSLKTGEGFLTRHFAESIKHNVESNIELALTSPDEFTRKIALILKEQQK